MLCTRKSRMLQVGCLFGFVLISQVARAGSDLIFEQFHTMDRWRPLTFPKIDTHSSYSVLEGEDGVASCLEMKSSGGASGLIFEKQFDVYDYPMLSWRWKVDDVYEKGDYRTKEGDDYPARLYVMFAYDPDSAGWGKQLKYGTAKLLYGEYPPDSTLNYIWANQADTPDVITNAYVDEAKMLPVDRGESQLGEWRQYQVDIVADYRKAFGENPPRTAGLAVMIDSDNTGEKARSCVDFIRLSPKEVVEQESSGKGGQ